jgi:hypothetical protein
MALKFAVNNSLSAITTLPSSISDGALNLISTQTASASASISFTSGIDSTYDSYVFKFINCHPATDSTKFTFQADTGTNTNYNQTITSTFFRAAQDESATTDFGYKTADDQAQGTAFQTLCGTIGNANDESCSGTLQLFNPSSSTYVKHFIGRVHGYTNNDYSIDDFVAGYINTTTPITRVQFKFASGNIDDGIIKMYGVS